MNEIMRLRRIAGSDLEIEDRNNGSRHERGFVDNVRKNGILHEGDLLTDSYGGKLKPGTVPVLLDSLPAIVTALRRRKFPSAPPWAILTATSSSSTSATSTGSRRGPSASSSTSTSGVPGRPRKHALRADREDSAAVASGPNPRKLRDRPGAAS